MRTAKAVRSLLTCCDGKQPTALVGALVSAKLETSGTAMGRSLKSATAILGCLRTTKWDLFHAVALLQDARKTHAHLLLSDVRSWLKTDELALAGGLAPKLSDAESRAIKLLTPPTPKPKPEPEPEKKPDDVPIPGPTGKWKPLGLGANPD